jgi:non-specific serine/threonine protein kinase/serine/threonine-protein kinase
LTRLYPGSLAADLLIGPYRLRQQLGEGGMGEVWLAEQTDPVRRQVAVKVMKAGLDSAQVVERFRAERQALAIMDHPTIAKVFDGGVTAAGRPFFVMEYVRGEAITAYCDRHRLSTIDRLELFIPLCEGVQHAHQKGVIHRDLKPSNVLVALQGDRPLPRIIDFGIVKAIAQPLTDGSLFTQFGVLIGTPEYMSPEQADMSLDVDTRSDVYSLGVLLYELLVGALPFDGQQLRHAVIDDLRRILHQNTAPRPSARITELEAVAAGSIAEKRGTDAHKLARQLRGDLDWVVLKALEKDRTRRYQTASALAADLQRYLHYEAVSAGPPSAVYRLGKFARRHRAGVSISASLVVLLLVFAATMGVQASRIAREAVRANRAEQVALQEAATARAVVDFLRNDLLLQTSASTQAQSGARPDPELKVRTALDRAARSIAGKFDKQPVVEASIRYTMGITYKDLGLYDEAQGQLERALDLRRRELGENHVDTLTTAADLGLVLRRRGDSAKAEALLVSLLAASRRALGDAHPTTLQTMADLAGNYQDQGKFAEAEPLFVGALEARRRTQGSDHPDTLATMNNLSLLYRSEGRYSESEALIKEALDRSRRVRGEEHPGTMMNMNNLGALYYFQNRPAEAIPLFEKVLELRRRALGAEHPDTVMTTTNLATLYARQGQFAEGERLHKEALEIRLRVSGPMHPETLTGLTNLAAMYSTQGRYAEAEPLFVRSLEGRRKVLGDRHPATLATIEAYGEMSRRQGAYALAAARHSTVLDTRRIVLGESHPDTLRSAASLGLVRLQQQRYKEAESILRPAVGLYDKGAQDGWNRYNTESLLGASLVGQRRLAEAEPLLLSGVNGLLRLRDTIPIPNLHNLERAGQWVVRLYEDWRKPDKAAEWRRMLVRRTSSRQ